MKWAWVYVCDEFKPVEVPPHVNLLELVQYARPLIGECVKEIKGIKLLGGTNLD